MIYLDTSALVKKYVIENGTDRIRALLKNEKRVITSKLTYAEMCASFARKYREGGIEIKHYQKAWGSFINDWETLIRMEVREELFPLIRRLTEVYPLRGADAIHLASALWVEESTRETLTFVASDNNLLNTADLENLKTVNPED